MIIERSITVDVPVAQAWDAVAHRLHDVGHWVTGITASRKLDELGPAGIPHRQCDVPSLGTITERIDRFDSEQRTFSYVVIDGAPRIARHMGNTWTLRPVGERRTEIGFRLRVDLTPPASVLVGWLMKRQMSKACDEVCADLKTWLETGDVSSTKRVALAKAG